MKVDIKAISTMIFYSVIAYYAHRMTTSVDTLNVEMAKSMTLLVQHEKRLDKGGL